MTGQENEWVPCKPEAYRSAIVVWIAPTPATHRRTWIHHRLVSLQMHNESVMWPLRRSIYVKKLFCAILHTAQFLKLFATTALCFQLIMQLSEILAAEISNRNAIYAA